MTLFILGSTIFREFNLPEVAAAVRHRSEREEVQARRFSDEGPKLLLHACVHVRYLPRGGGQQMKGRAAFMSC